MIELRLKRVTTIPSDAVLELPNTQADHRVRLSDNAWRIPSPCLTLVAIRLRRFVSTFLSERQSCKESEREQIYPEAIAFPTSFVSVDS